MKNGKALGFVLNEEFMPVKDAKIVTLFGDSSLSEISVDSDGRFAIDNMQEDKSLLVSSSGYETQIIKPDFNSKMIIVLTKTTEKDTRPVRGYVVNKSGENLNGVQVALKNNNTKAITGNSGRFTVFGVKQSDSLVFSYKGYRIQTLKPLFYSAMLVKLNIGPEFMSPMKEGRDTSPSSKPGSIFLVGGRIHVFGNTQRNLKGSTESGVSQELLKEYQNIIDKYKRTTKYGKESYYMNYTQEEKVKLEFIFFQMSKEQQSKQMFVFIPCSSMFLKKNVPTTEQIESFKDPKAYGVWIDRSRVNNELLNKYKNTDFAYVSSSKLAKNAANYGKHIYQVDLLTNSYYQDYYDKTISQTGNTLVARVLLNSGADKK